jgi:SAM-dependent methyltransferase
MTATANLSAFETWNGDSGRRWVATADQHDAILAPAADALLAAARLSEGDRVLDIGCGCGATTLMAAGSIGDAGSVVGVDISGPMLDLARQRAAEAGISNAAFVHADAQTHAFEMGSVDLVISRFGTMFFANPDAAFANIATALRPAGRLCLATWQPLVANEWLIAPGAVLLNHTDLPADAPDEPGMFAQSEPDRVTATLHAAGFTNIDLAATALTFTLGQTIDEAVDFLAASGPGRALLETIADGPTRDAAVADVRDLLVTYQDASGVRLGGAIWIITATRPG